VIVLALDSRSVRGSVALWREGRVAEMRSSDPGRSFSGQLPELLVRLAADHGLALAEVDVFAACTGPGSLTGLRVGLATIQGLAFATGRLVVGVSALEAVAVDAVGERAAQGTPWVGAWLDAFRGEVFTALYRTSDSAGVSGTRLVEVEPPAVGSPEATVARWSEVTAGSTCVVAGDSVGRLALAAGLGGRAVFHEASLLAGTVATLAAERAAAGEAARPHALQPLYVRRPDAEAARERRLAGGAPEAGR
jgi:tRNA threonylcarbamoyladenosine biosynthesis protein TsaB